ncbi:hypothetical protein E4T39_01695 [Aureobasidium subglaciale]|nr:hypothetical protein E4T39_01695 [Aureobasidium subglaciale]
MDLAIARTLAMKRDLDVLAARSRKETLGICQSIMAQAYPPCALPLSALSKNAYDGTRGSLLPAADSFELAEPPIAVDERTIPAQDLIDQVKLYVEKIEDTYPPHIFVDLPRCGLIKRHTWLMKAFAMLDCNIALMYAQDVVRDHGFKPILNNAGILIDLDRSNIVLTTEVVDAFAFMGAYYEIKRRVALSRLMKKLARENYVILNGSAVGFELVYEL